jgi:LysR family hydrogen peroxide-inducible transcriptional activator
MNLRDLEYVLALEAERSFSRAAERCGVAQPTLSAQVRKLEDSLGVALFERAGRDLRVTAAGETILEQARLAVDAVRRIEELAGAHADPRVGPVRLGVIPTLAPYILPQALPAVAKQLPLAPLIVVEDLTERLLSSLGGGQLDAAIVATDVPPGKLSEVVLFDEPFRLAVPLGHRLAVGESPLDIASVDPATMILLADGHCLADQAQALCRAAGNAGRASDLRATSLETVLNLVEGALGVTIVPELARAQVAKRFPGIAFRELSGRAAQRRVRIVYRAFSPRRSVIAEIGACVQSSIAGTLQVAP